MNIIVFGNSIAQGAFDVERGGWVNRLGSYCWGLSLNDEHYVKVFNLGISGENILGVRARIENEIDPRIGDEGTFILFAVGINDTKINISTGEHKTDLVIYERLLNELGDIAVAKRIPYAFLGLTPVDEKRLDPIPWQPGFAYRMSEVEKFDSLIEKVAKERNVLFIPMRDVLENDYEKLLPDGLHPNSEGHKRMYERVKEYLTKAKILP